MNSTPKISILVPCYNVEKYLHQCIDSILEQTFTDMEILCLNDGSTDSTPDILKEYAEKDDRIIVVNKPNSGYGATMNIGLKMAKGKYIGIVESDDYIEKEMFGTLYDRAEKDSLDITRCLYIERNMTNGRNHVVTHQFSSKYDKVLNPKELQEIFFIQPSIWVGLYRRDFLERNGIRFLETPGASFQDTSFAFKVYACAERVEFIPKVLHNYRINESSSVTSPSKVFFVCDEEAEIRRFAAERGLSDLLKEAMAFRAFGSYKWNYNRLGPMKLKRMFMKRWSEEAKEMFRNGEVTRRYFSKNRIFRLRLIAYCPWIYYFIRKA